MRISRTAIPALFTCFLLALYTSAHCRPPKRKSSRRSRRAEQTLEGKKRFLGLLCASGGYRTVILQAVLDRNIENGVEAVKEISSMNPGTLDESARLLQESPAIE